MRVLFGFFVILCLHLQLNYATKPESWKWKAAKKIDEIYEKKVKWQLRMIEKKWRLLLGDRIKTNCTTEWELMKQPHCQTKYEEICAEVYEPRCSLEYNKHCSMEYHDQCSTEYTNECSQHYEQECKEWQETECGLVNEEKCEVEQVRECHQQQEQQCQRKYSTECNTHLKTECKNWEVNLSIITVSLRSPFYSVTYYRKRVETSWTYSIVVFLLNICWTITAWFLF